MPPAMRTRGSRARTIGLTVMLLSVSAAMHLGAGGFGLLLYFAGVLVATGLLAVGVRMADSPEPIVIVTVVFSSAQALVTFVYSNAVAMGLVMASCAFTVVSGKEDPVLCFSMFALLLLGITFINMGARGWL